MNHDATRGEIDGNAAWMPGELRELIEQIRRHFPELAEPFTGAAVRRNLKEGARHLVSSLIEQMPRQEPSGDDADRREYRVPRSVRLQPLLQKSHRLFAHALQGAARQAVPPGQPVTPPAETIEWVEFSTAC